MLVRCEIGLFLAGFMCIFEEVDSFRFASLGGASYIAGGLFLISVITVNSRFLFEFGGNMIGILNSFSWTIAKFSFQLELFLHFMSSALMF